MTVALTILALLLPADRGGHATVVPAHGGHAEAVTLTPIQIGRDLAARRGWVGEQWACLVRLWSRESGWVATKENYAGSGAYGIPQALPGSKMASAGADWRTNPTTQIRWGLSYIEARYGTACGAWAHSEAQGFY